jgi:hypothetical protein
MKPAYKLENWGITYSSDPYTAPELREPQLVGDRGDKFVTTSKVLGKHGAYVVTQNSLYELGEPDPEYEKQFPNARARLFTTLAEVQA